jgi:hypothetical protein
VAAGASDAGRGAAQRHRAREALLKKPGCAVGGDQHRGERGGCNVSKFMKSKLCSNLIQNIKNINK